MRQTLIFDIETDRLRATRVWCLNALCVETEERWSFVGHNEVITKGIDLLLSSRFTRVVASNGLAFDFIVLDVLSAGRLKEADNGQWMRHVAWDTVLLSNILFGSRRFTHGLEGWLRDLQLDGVEKTKPSDYWPDDGSGGKGEDGRQWSRDQVDVGKGPGGTTVLSKALVDYCWADVEGTAEVWKRVFAPFLDANDAIDGVITLPELNELYSNYDVNAFRGGRCFDVSSRVKPGDILPYTFRQIGSSYSPWVEGQYGVWCGDEQRGARVFEGAKEEKSGLSEEDLFSGQEEGRVDRVFTPGLATGASLTVKENGGPVVRLYCDPLHTQLLFTSVQALREDHYAAFMLGRARWRGMTFNLAKATALKERLSEEVDALDGAVWKIASKTLPSELPVKMSRAEVSKTGLPVWSRVEHLLGFVPVRKAEEEFERFDQFMSFMKTIAPQEYSTEVVQRLYDKQAQLAAKPTNSRGKTLIKVGTGRGERVWKSSLSRVYKRLEWMTRIGGNGYQSRGLWCGVEGMHQKTKRSRDGVRKDGSYWHPETGVRVSTLKSRWEPGSTLWLARLLVELGWKIAPDEWTDESSPSVTEDTLDRIISQQGGKRLETREEKYTCEPTLLNTARMIQRRMIVSKVVSMIETFSASVDPQTGKIHPRIKAWGAATGRMTHNSPNISQAPGNDAPYGSDFRECFDGEVYADCDQAGIEIRALCVYLWPHDKSYTDVVLGGDLHSYNKERLVLANRTEAKRVLFSVMYGGGAAKVGSICEPNAARPRQVERGKEVVEKLRTEIGGYGALQDTLKGWVDWCNHSAVVRRGYAPETRKMVAATMGKDGALETLRRNSAVRGVFLMDVRGHRLDMTSGHLALNYCLQSFGACATKRWMWRLGEDDKLRAVVHDELLLGLGSEAYKDKVIEEGTKVQGDLGVPVPIGVAGKTGNNWSEVH